MFLKRWGVLLTIGALIAAAGCSTVPEPADERLAVAVAFYPFEFVTQRVGGDQVRVTNLTQPGTEPHDLELTPQQVVALAQADLVVYQSGFQPAVDAGVEQAAPAHTVDAAGFLTFLHAEADNDGHTGEHGEHEQLDPHTWLDPTNLVTVAEHVRDALSQARPEAAAGFAAATDDLVAELTGLDADFERGLARCQRRTFITSHAAFGYLADRYQLTQVGIRGLEPDVEPTAARIAEVHQIARDQGVTTIFFETLVSPVVAESVAGDLGLATDVLDPLEGITAESRGTTYTEVMRANLGALRTANQCS